MDTTYTEALAGKLFALSLPPYLAFLYFLHVPQNNTPKGVIVGFATYLLFTFQAIPAAIAAKLWYGVRLSECDWLHGAAAFLLALTNLPIVVSLRQALTYEKKLQRGNLTVLIPKSVANYGPMIKVVLSLNSFNLLIALSHCLKGSQDFSPYLNGMLDIPISYIPWRAPHTEPQQALSVLCWSFHVVTLIEFCHVMILFWKYAEVTNNPKWRELTWAFLPLQAASTTALVSHVFYSSISVLEPLQAFFTLIGNITSMIASYRIAKSNGWCFTLRKNRHQSGCCHNSTISMMQTIKRKPSIACEDVGVSLNSEVDILYMIKSFGLSTIVSYILKYGEVWFNFPFESQLDVALAFIFLPSFLMMFKLTQDLTSEKDLFC